MTTTWSYVPSIGDFSAPRFFAISSTGVQIPRDPSLPFSGSPRPGVLKWFLTLISTDTSVENFVQIYVQSPFPVKTPAVFYPNLSVNSVFPDVSLSLGGPSCFDQKVCVQQGAAGDPSDPIFAATLAPFIAAGLTPNLDYMFSVVTVQAFLPDVNPIGVSLTLDFSHSLIN